MIELSLVDVKVSDECAHVLTIVDGVLPQGFLKQIKISDLKKRIDSHEDVRRQLMSEFHDQGASRFHRDRCLEMANQVQFDADKLKSQLVELLNANH